MTDSTDQFGAMEETISLVKEIREMLRGSSIQPGYVPREYKRSNTFSPGRHLHEGLHSLMANPGTMLNAEWTTIDENTVELRFNFNGNRTLRAWRFNLFEVSPHFDSQDANRAT